MTPKTRLKVQVWICLKDAKKNSWRVLLLQTKPERGGFWQPVTGGVNDGEALPAAALREASEESGIRFASAPESLDYEFSFQYGDVKFIEHAFMLKIEGEQLEPPVIRLDPNEHFDSRWVRPVEAFEMLEYKSNARVLELVLKCLGIEREATK